MADSITRGQSVVYALWTQSHKALRLADRNESWTLDQRKEPCLVEDQRGGSFPSAKSSSFRFLAECGDSPFLLCLPPRLSLSGTMLFCSPRRVPLCLHSCCTPTSFPSLRSVPTTSSPTAVPTPGDHLQQDRNTELDWCPSLFTLLLYAAPPPKRVPHSRADVWRRS